MLSRSNAAQNYFDKQIGDWYQSAYLQILIVVSMERGIFMKIQMEFDEHCIKYILEHNLSEKIMPYISLGEVLLWMTEHPDVLEKVEPHYLWTGGREVGVVLEMKKEDDTYHVTVYDVIPDDGRFER